MENLVSNELLWLVFILVQFGLLVLTYKLFGLTGLYAWIGFAIVAANIQVVKLIELFGLSATLGNIMYGSIFLATDLINEKYGKKKAQKAVYIGFVIMIAFTIITQISLRFAPIAGDEYALGVQESLTSLFALLPRITAGSVIAYIISQSIDVYVFDKIRAKFSSDRQLWIRNNGSTLISQLIDTIIFTVIAFAGVFDMGTFMSVLWFSYIIKIITSIADTPFVYWMRKIQPMED